MNKLEYLTKTLSRTKRKDYENYVLNRIYTLINNFDLKPVSQQYVNTDDSHYLIDLYFPQLNIGIECDELFHNNQKEEDIKRENNIIEKLSEYNVLTQITTPAKIFRVEITEDINYVNKQIDEIVKMVNLKIKNLNLKWDIDIDSQINEIKEKGFLSVDDNILFPTIKDAANLFGKNYKGMQRSFWKKEEGLYFWFPKLAIEKNNEIIANNSHGWINTLSTDCSEIIQKNHQLDRKEPIKNPPNRITFMKIKNNATGEEGYKFLGVFECLFDYQNDCKFKILDKKINLY